MKSRFFLMILMTWHQSNFLWVFSFCVADWTAACMSPSAFVQFFEVLFPLIKPSFCSYIHTKRKKLMSAGSDHHGDFPKVKSDISSYWPVSRHYGSAKTSSPKSQILLAVSYLLEKSCRVRAWSLIKPDPAATSAPCSRDARGCALGLSQPARRVKQRIPRKDVAY